MEINFWFSSLSTPIISDLLAEAPNGECRLFRRLESRLQPAEPLSHPSVWRVLKAIVLSYAPPAEAGTRVPGRSGLSG